MEAAAWRMPGSAEQRLWIRMWSRLFTESGLIPGMFDLDKRLLLLLIINYINLRILLLC